MLKKTEIESIEKKALEHRSLKGLGYDAPIGNKIFDILEYQYKVNLFIYPLKSKNICGFTQKKDEKFSVFVNSGLRRCLQNFVCAHELYHVTQSKNYEEENLIICDAKDISEDMSETDISHDELKANYFAASFLLPERLIKERFSIFETDTSNISDLLLEILKIQYNFEVPYKTILKRLCEVGITSEEIYKNLMDLESNMTEYCKMYDEELCQNIRYQQEADKRMYSSLNVTKTAYDVYMKNALTYSKLKQILNRYRKDPDDFGVTEENDEPIGIDFSNYGSGKEESESES